MDLKWQATMKAAISEVLETMFFTAVEFEGDGPDTTEACCESQISLRRGSERIDIILQLGQLFATMITANFLGKEEDEVLPEDIEDTLKEVANMVGGDFLLRVQEPDWRLGLPDYRQTAANKAEAVDGVPFYFMEEPMGRFFMLSTPADGR